MIGDQFVIGFDQISDHPSDQTGDTNGSIRIRSISDGSLDIRFDRISEHTSPAYCLRVKDGQQYCRFGYSKDNVEHTIVQDNGHGQPELITKRNDPFINSHNRLQLQGWRANVNLKPILSIHAALQYISKYASKAEPQSAAFSEILNQVLSNSKPDDPILTPVQKLLLHSVAERDISAQETCHLLLGIPLYHSSRSFVSLNLNKEAAR